MSTINWSLQLWGDTAANWSANNPILLDRQVGLESNGGVYTQFKVGDGVTPWNSLNYFIISTNGTLNQVLTAGNITNGKNIILSDDDIIQIGSTPNRYIRYSTSTILGGLELVNLNSNDHIILQDAGGIHIDTTLAGFEGDIKLNNTNKKIILGLGAELFYDGTYSYFKAGTNEYYQLGSGTGTKIFTNSQVDIISQSGAEVFVGQGYGVYLSADTSGAKSIDLRPTGLTIAHTGTVNMNLGGDLALIGGFMMSSQTASTVPYLDSNKRLISSSVTNTELGYLSGVTSSIQTQFGDTNITSKVLTGLSITGGSIVSTDSILQAFGKVQNQLNAVAGAMDYQGTWNANTNSPTLTSSTGTKGYVYRVSVSGSTNLDGITDWKAGDFAVFNGSTWDKWDATDAVTSVNGYTGTVSLVTGDIAESSNLYFTNARVDSRVAAYTGDVTLTGTLFSIGAGKVTNTMLVNSSLTVNGTSISLGSSGTITANTTNSLTVDNSSLQLDSGTTFNGSAAKTISVKALGITNAMLAGSIAFSKLNAFGGTNTILYTTAANTPASSSNLTYDGTTFATATSAGECAYFSGSNTGTAITNGCGIFITNSSATTNNYASIGFRDMVAGTSSGSIMFQFTDRTNHYGDIVLVARGADGFFERLRATNTGNIVLGNQAALATNATNGFVYIPTSAGAPTGVPTAYTGKVAAEFDTTNNKLYIYNGGWKSITLT